MASNCVFQANAFVNPILAPGVGNTFHLAQLTSEEYIARTSHLRLKLYKDNRRDHEDLYPFYSSMSPDFSTREVSTSSLPKKSKSMLSSRAQRRARETEASIARGLFHKFTSLFAFINDTLREKSPIVTHDHRTRSLNVGDTFKRNKKDNQYQVISLVDISWLKAHEEIVSEERVFKLHEAVKEWKAFRLPLLVDVRSGAILDGHHRYAVGRRMGLSKLPAILVDYLHDEKIKLDVWPECGIDCLTKEEVINMSLSEDVFPPKTSKHAFEDHSLPPINVPLEHLQ